MKPKFAIGDKFGSPLGVYEIIKYLGFQSLGQRANQPAYLVMFDNGLREQILFERHIDNDHFLSHLQSKEDGR